MSYANGTPFLNLAQTVGTDHRDWFDENEAKLDLDTKMKTLWDERTSTTAILAALQESVATLDTDVTSLSGIVSGHTTTIATINESLVLINTALNALNTQVVGKFDSVGIADPYDAAHGIYAIDDVVTYNGQRYVCITAVTAAEPFDVSKWRAEDVQTVIDEINVNLSEKASTDYVDEKVANILGFPDFSNVIETITSTSSHTFNSDGWLVGYFRNTSSNSSLKINDITVAMAGGSANSYEYRGGVQIPIKSGDVLTWATTPTNVALTLVGIR